MRSCGKIAAVVLLCGLVVTAGAAASAQQPSTPAQRPSTALSRSGFTWPLQGPLLSLFGPRGRGHHDGIDIKGAVGAPIGAALAGRVTLAGWYFGYGRTVIVDHGGGLTSLYGHASALLVRKGDKVHRGQVIARVGCSGRCSGPHVHFEIRVHGRPANPLAYLTPQVAVAPAPPQSGPGKSAQAPPSQTGGRKILRSVVVDDGTVTEITDTFQNGNLVTRVEEVVMTAGEWPVRITREYRPIDGILTLITERVAVRGADEDERSIGP